MSEENQTNGDKQEALKQKLKDMGVMQDENAAPKAKRTSFFSSKWFVLSVIFIAVGFWYWYSESQMDNNNDESASESTLPVNPQTAMYPPPPMVQGPPPVSAGPEQESTGQATAAATARPYPYRQFGPYPGRPAYSWTPPPPGYYGPRFYGPPPVPYGYPYYGAYPPPYPY